MNAMVLLIMPLALHDADIVKLLKSHVASYFSQLALTSAVVVLMMPSVLCDAIGGKCHVVTIFSLM